MAANGLQNRRGGTHTRLRYRGYAKEAMRGRTSLTVSSRAFDAVIFDLDGVVTDTAAVHAVAWKQVFDEYLAERSGTEKASFRPFTEQDYLTYVDGKPRYEGVSSFLASRGIALPYGDPADGPDRETVCGVGNRKNKRFLEEVARTGVTPFAATVDFARRVRRAGIRAGVISSSANAQAILEAAGVEDLFDIRVDGRDSSRLGLAGKPAPDIFLEAARRLGVEPSRAVVVEDALAGAKAGRSGGFGFVIGIGRGSHAENLVKHGADASVSDLSEIDLEDDSDANGVPSALAHLDSIVTAARGKRPVLFLDYDGTLTPIVDRPEDATLAGEVRGLLQTLARTCIVAIVSGRDLEDVRSRVGLDSVHYAGSHGFDLQGPGNLGTKHEAAGTFLPALDRAEQALRDRLAAVSGAQVERKRFAIAVHYRRVGPQDVEAVEQAVDAIRAIHPELRKATGKKIFELQPDIDWNKGRAVLWLLEEFGLFGDAALPIYIGDDVTDEDAFRALAGRGIGIVVADGGRPTAARYSLRDTDEVRAFLSALSARLCAGQE